MSTEFLANGDGETGALVGPSSKGQHALSSRGPNATTGDHGRRAPNGTLLKARSPSTSSIRKHPRTPTTYTVTRAIGG